MPRNAFENRHSGAFAFQIDADIYGQWPLKHSGAFRQRLDHSGAFRGIQGHSDRPMGIQTGWDAHGPLEDKPMGIQERPGAGRLEHGVLYKRDKAKLVFPFLMEEHGGVMFLH